MSKFRKARGWLTGLTGVALLLGGFALASNMGFKFVPNIAAGGGFNLSLPWNNNYNTAKDLFDDISPQKVAKVESDSTFTEWFGPGGGVDFPVAKGEAYFVTASSSGALTPVIVGSHDPNYTMSFTGGEGFNASAPYHQTLSSAKDLFIDMNTALSDTIQKLAKIESDSTFTEWFGPGGGVDFALDLGMGVYVTASADTGAYAWPHY